MIIHVCCILYAHRFVGCWKYLLHIFRSLKKQQLLIKCCLGWQLLLQVRRNATLHLHDLHLRYKKYNNKLQMLWIKQSSKKQTYSWSITMYLVWATPGQAFSPLIPPEGKRLPTKTSLEWVPGGCPAKIFVSFALHFWWICSQK